MTDETLTPSEQIEANVSALLESWGFKYSTQYCGQQETKQSDGKAWEHDAWRVMFAHKMVRGKDWTTDYRTGLGLRTPPKHRIGCPSGNSPYSRRERARWIEENSKPKAPSAASVLHSLTMEATAGNTSFADWCSDFGYSDDSLSALDTYRACCDIAKELHQLFTREQIEAIRNATQDY